jgi:hypothetical protein
MISIVKFNGSSSESSTPTRSSPIESDYSFYSDPSLDNDETTPQIMFDDCDVACHTILRNMSLSDDLRYIPSKVVLLSYECENYPTLCRQFHCEQLNEEIRNDSLPYKLVNQESNPSVLVSLSIIGARIVKTSICCFPLYQLEYNILFYIDNQSYVIWKPSRKIAKFLFHLSHHSVTQSELMKNTSLYNLCLLVKYRWKLIQYWIIVMLDSCIAVNISEKYARKELSRVQGMFNDVFYEVMDMATLMKFLVGSLEVLYVPKHHTNNTIVNAYQDAMRDAIHSSSSRRKKKQGIRYAIMATLALIIALSLYMSGWFSSQHSKSRILCLGLFSKFGESIVSSSMMNSFLSAIINYL